jgi:hypothetical protein
LKKVKIGAPVEFPRGSPIPRGKNRRIGEFKIGCIPYLIS